MCYFTFPLPGRNHLCWYYRLVLTSGSRLTPLMAYLGDRHESGDPTGDRMGVGVGVDYGHLCL